MQTMMQARCDDAMGGRASALRPGLALPMTGARLRRFPAKGTETGPPGGAACEIVRAVVDALFSVIEGADARPSRRAVIQRRQIAMYVMHVVLRCSLTDIGKAFGRDRTTVSHACAVVEDRRDDAGYDRFVTTVEELVAKVFSAGRTGHGGR